MRNFAFVLCAICLFACDTPISESGNSRLSGERFQNDKPWGYNLVSEPARAGTVAQRFEVRPGDCGFHPGGFSDCELGNERSEIELDRNIPFPGQVWLGFSLFVPPDFTNGPNLFQTKVLQMKFRGGPRSDQAIIGSLNQLLAMQIERDKNALTLCLYRFQVQNGDWSDRCDKTSLTSLNSMRGRWTEILLNYDSNGTGQMAVYVNGVQRASESDFVRFDADNVFFAYGIYRPASGISGPLPIQIAYFDEMRIGQTREEVELDVENPVD